MSERTEDFAVGIDWYEKALAVAEKFKKPEFFASEVNTVDEQIATCKAKFAKQKSRETAPPPRLIKEK